MTFTSITCIYYLCCCFYLSFRMHWWYESLLCQFPALQYRHHLPLHMWLLLLGKEIEVARIHSKVLRVTLPTLLEVTINFQCSVCMPVKYLPSAFSLLYKRVLHAVRPSFWDTLVTENEWANIAISPPPVVQVKPQGVCCCTFLSVALFLAHINWIIGRDN